MPTAAMSIAVAVHRIEVRPKPGAADASAEQAMRALAQADAGHRPKAMHAARVYLIEAALSREQVRRIAGELLTDPVTQQFTVGAAKTTQSDSVTVEVHPLPGVMDPDAEAVQQAAHAMLGMDLSVRTGVRYEMAGVSLQQAAELVRRNLANSLIQSVVTEPFHPPAFAHGTKYELRLVDVPLRELDDAQLTLLSRKAHLFLSLAEMQAIREHFRGLGREPRDIELETLAQTWSEHCVHKTLKSTVVYSEAGDAAFDFSNRPGHTRNPDGSITIDNLLKSTIAAATEELMKDGVDWCLSVFKDNAGVIAFDDEFAVCCKVETHNHPSALEPYGGAATGIGGCIRDIIGTGLAARPIANTDVFCVAHAEHFTAASAEDAEKEKDYSDSDSASDSDLELQDVRQNSPSAISAHSAVHPLPAGVLHPRRILSRVVAGVRDYGNRMGIPTLNGAVWFDDDYIGNPLVFCGCVGVMPRDKVFGEPKKDDHIIVLGGRTARDGVHGATFSSAELTDTHADEFSHAVQIGNAVTEKKVLDAILAARDHDNGCLYHAITDCGAGGLSSAVGEMGEKLGAEVFLERVPLKYAGLSPVEIWISEAQERMVLAAPAESLDELREICELHEVELCDLGEFGTANRELILNYCGTEVGRLGMQFLHEGIPLTTRSAVWNPLPSPPGSGVAGEGSVASSTPPSIEDALFALLAHPNIASKHWIVRQYDHEVQGQTVVKPLVGAHGNGPGDAAVIRPVANSSKGLAIACGLATGLRDDPYVMALAAIDECVRNLVCVGSDPDRIAILDNFCWPSCDDPQQMAALVRAAEGCYDGAKAYRAPFVSGKDSLNNQFTAEDGRTIRIPPTLLITGIGIVPDVGKCVTSDAKKAGNVLALIGATQPWLRGSHYAMLFGDEGQEVMPQVDLELGPKIARCVHSMISAGLIASAHDGNEGGLLVTAAEMCMGGGLGLNLDGLAEHLKTYPINPAKACFGESASTYFLEVDERNIPAIEAMVAQHSLPVETMAVVGRFNHTGRLTLDGHVDVTLDELTRAWRGTLDW